MGAEKSWTHVERVFEAVRGRLLVALAVLLSPLAEEEGPLVQEQVPLHGLEACQLLHARGASLVADPHAERALHEHTAQVTQLSLHSQREKRAMESC